MPAVLAGAVGPFPNAPNFGGTQIVLVSRIAATATPPQLRRPAIGTPQTC